MLSVQYVYIPQHRSNTQTRTTVSVVSTTCMIDLIVHMTTYRATFHTHQSESLLTTCEQSPSGHLLDPGWQVRSTAATLPEGGCNRHGASPVLQAE
jgi:hypothetical protein